MSDVAPSTAVTPTVAVDDEALNDPALRIGIEEYKDLVARDQVVTIDVRSAAEYSEGRLPGAISIPLDTLEARLSGLARGGRAVVTYCS